MEFACVKMDMLLTLLEFVLFALASAMPSSSTVSVQSVLEVKSSMAVQAVSAPPEELNRGAFVLPSVRMMSLSMLTETATHACSTK